MGEVVGVRHSPAVNLHASSASNDSNRMMSGQYRAPTRPRGAAQDQLADTATRKERIGLTPTHDKAGTPGGTGDLGGGWRRAESG